MSRILSAAAATVALGGVFGGVALTTRDAEPPTAVLGVTVASRTENANEHARGLLKQRIVATGSVTGLYPGAVRDLAVSLRNDNNFVVAVTDVVVDVRSDTPGCSHHMVRVDEFHGSRLVPANATATQVMAARMHNDAAEACKDAAFTLTFTGTAVKS